MNRQNGFAGMIIEFDSIRTACELWKSSVRYARFRRYGHSVRRLLSSVVERVLRKDEVGSSILPEGIFLFSFACVSAPSSCSGTSSRRCRIQRALLRPETRRGSEDVRARVQGGPHTFFGVSFLGCGVAAQNRKRSGRYCRGPRGVERHNHHAPSRQTASSDAAHL